MKSSSIELDDTRTSSSMVTIIDRLQQHDAVWLDQAQQKLRGLDTNKLCTLAYVGIQQKKRVAAFLANGELTRRGIPPCFRGLPEPNDDAVQVADLIATDLDWIAARYPDHKTFFGRWKGFNSEKIKSRWATTRFICNWQTRDMWKYVKGLALSEAQEWECHYLHREKIARAQDAIKRNREDVAGKLRQQRYKRKLKLLTDEELADFERWLEVWACANMGGWKSPTRVAWLYTAKTGNPLSRQMAAKIMDKLRRDLPAKSCRL